MSGFSAEWLKLREPVDAAARNSELAACLLDWRRRHGSLAILDLAGGTGANCRFLAPLLGGEQHWRIVDHDPALLAQGAMEMRSWADRMRDCHLQWLQLDLLHDWERLDTQGAQLVTASALLDLVSADWLQQLAQCCQQWQAAVFIVLSYDGEILWEPTLADDERVRIWLNRHQRTDKGFGAALGPDAALMLASLLQQQGYKVMMRPSPWRLGSEHAVLQRALLDSWIKAVLEIAPETASELAGWLTQRRYWIECRRSRLQVGHWDLWAWLDDRD